MSKKIEKGIEVMVVPDRDYRYRVAAGDVFGVTYDEDGREDKPEITFGSVEEMEETARAMLFVAKAARELGIN